MGADRADRLRVATPILFSAPIKPDNNGHALWFLSTALATLSEPKIDYDKMLQLVSRQSNTEYWDVPIEAISRAADAGVWADQESAPEWLKKLSSLFDGEYAEKGSSNVCLGVLLGALRACNRLGPRSLEKPAIDEVQQILVKVLAVKNGMLDRIFSVCYDEQHRKRDQQVKGWLSEAIKSFVEGPYPHGNGARKRESIDILKEAFDKIEAVKKDMPHYVFMCSLELRPTNLAMFVGEQLTFAVFAKMDMLERARAIALCFK